jgi:hypothetical protein
MISERASCCRWQLGRHPRTPRLECQAARFYELVPSIRGREVARAGGRVSGAASGEDYCAWLRRNRLRCSSAHFTSFFDHSSKSAERQSVYVGPSRPIRRTACKRCRRQRRRSRNSQEARLCPRPRYRVPSFCPVPGESRRCQLPTGKSRHIFASTEIITGALRMAFCPQSPTFEPDKILRRDAFQKTSKKKSGFRGGRIGA